MLIQFSVENFLSIKDNVVLSLLASKDNAVYYTHIRAHETPELLVCRLLLEKKKKKKIQGPGGPPNL